jgi:hypothetical protein
MLLKAGANIEAEEDVRIIQQLFLNAMENNNYYHDRINSDHCIWPQLEDNLSSLKCS